jgi:hypothetical protein
MHIVYKQGFPLSDPNSHKKKEKRETGEDSMSSCLGQMPTIRIELMTLSLLVTRSTTEPSGLVDEHASTLGDIS